MTLIEKCREFVGLLKKHSDFGAEDSEVISKFYGSLSRKIHKNITRIPENKMEWELYDIDGADAVANELTENLRSLIDSIDSSTFLEVKEVMEKYLYD